MAPRQCTTGEVRSCSPHNAQHSTKIYPSQPYSNASATQIIHPHLLPILNIVQVYYYIHHIRHV